MRIGLAQINPTMGDIEGNTKKIIEYIERSHEKHCELVVFPELCVIGYNPNDLLERVEVIEASQKAVQKIKKAVPKNMTVIIGSITSSKKKSTKPYHNSAIILGRKDGVVSKTLLPSYDVFDETRFLTSGEPKNHLVRIGNKNVLVLVCEDIWATERSEHTNFLNLYKKKKVDLVVNINGSPFALSKKKRRERVVSDTAKYLKAPVVYVNCVGGQDEIIYDGGSFVMNPKGQVIAQSARFVEDLNVIDLAKNIGGVRNASQNDIEAIQQALVLGIRDFARKNNFKTLHLGVSGGIDSAVVLALAADAVGPRSVVGIAMPGPFSAEESLTEAQKLCKNIGCGFHAISIKDAYETMIKNFDSEFGDQEFGLVHENVQARIRGMYLMMYANLKGSLLLTTGNKSEMATGYCTLYGDMCGGLNPMGDLLKHQVYDIARLYNRERELIPHHILERPPSAELRPNQKDQDTLPPYDVLDKAVDNLVAGAKPARTETDQWLLKRLAASEFKRWQAPPILRISDHAFGRGRRLPITNGFYR